MPPSRRTHKDLPANLYPATDTRDGVTVNPNNCETCDYTKLNCNMDGHCYMFRDEPTEVCMVHTGRKPKSFFAALAAKQVPLCSEFADVLHANLWDLYES